ncbi:hypothetical protein CAEBREN_22596 [Caenorhabditis brenneri]|uniref:Uncharacterized protein n=1 Tax=Caenorhabditis brenneri TaxID=135651 RepID=G0PGM6_CAEBE|nr:hypothetical protein CAEBREN_22596 [Caenorhabditis brenneri]
MDLEKLVERISCIIFYHKTVRLLFILSSIPLPIGNEIWMDFVKPSEKLQSYSEASHIEAVRKLTVEDFAYFVVDWNFCYLILAFLIPYLIFFVISLFFHRLYIRSIRNISNDCIDMGYHHSYTISQTFLSIALQNFLFVSLPHFILAITILIRWELGIRALPFSFGAAVIPLTTATTLFIHFRAYRRQVGFLFIELLRQNNVNIPIFVINHPQPSTHLQMSAAAIG